MDTYVGECHECDGELWIDFDTGIIHCDKCCYKEYPVLLEE